MTPRTEHRPDMSFKGHGEWSPPDGALMAVEVTSWDADAARRDRVDKPDARAGGLRSGPGRLPGPGRQASEVWAGSVTGRLPLRRVPKGARQSPVPG